MLASLLGCRVANAGVPGEVTAKGLARLPAVLAAERPDLVILCHGGNDLLQHIDADEIAKNISAMAEMARRAGADVILVAVPSPSLSLSPPRFYRQVARRYRLPCEEDALRRILSRPGWKSDEVHPNAEGYRHLAEALRDLVRRSAPAG